MSYHQLTPQERYLISHLRKQGLCVAQIARQLRRHRSTIAREFARNENRKGIYRPSKAQENTNGRRSRSRRNGHFSQADGCPLYSQAVEPRTGIGVRWSVPDLGGVATF